MKDITPKSSSLNGYSNHPTKASSFVDLSLFPTKAVESLAVSLLQQQQKEISSRLKIAIQYIEKLEKQNQHLLHEKHKLEESLYAMRDQIYLYQEKDEFCKQAYQKNLQEFQKDLKELQRNLLLSEKEYVELYKQNQEIIQCCKNYEKKITTYRRYRHRIEIKVRPFINALKRKCKLSPKPTLPLK